ncbi:MULTISPECIES: NAD(P)H-dependent oxidoreductase [unclassified Sphingobacterium]|uniref:NAD(P)H-dependent oxidoreductase n=1 Tax=unclassified Sphingobacterium TaxID=2609468 RepID=UPI0010490150|nr:MULTISPECIES: NAD(P)H-dependent oxidoreductase [unclassified Sphingobacterium]MCS3552507.1 putative NADPH-quinone reductase [Sphingobacterium sp. JUb21]TCR10731.1 putative NADPH-quinone reductase [Sphingobacterium sp. JUb20]
MKKIVVINGHPDKLSFNSALANAYIKAAKESGADVRYIALADLDFNPNLQFGYRQRMELEPDLLQALQTIQWGEHQVWIHPLWWLGMPALMKGFFDRAFLPGITFGKSKQGLNVGLLQNKTARIITTAGDLNLKTYKEVYGSSGLIQLKNGILEYCGITSIQSSFIGPLENFDEADRLKALNDVADLARDDAKALPIGIVADDSIPYIG